MSASEDTAGPSHYVEDDGLYSEDDQYRTGAATDALDMEDEELNRGLNELNIDTVLPTPNQTPTSQQARGHVTSRQRPARAQKSRRCQ
jgi:hypothetical protein